MSFSGMRRSIDPMLVFGKRGWLQAPLPLIVCDESPAGYSSAGCAPAEPTSASPAGVHDTLAGAGAKQQVSERQVSNLWIVSTKGAAQATAFVTFRRFRHGFRSQDGEPHRKTGK
jgi:hypothetical protein